MRSWPLIARIALVVVAAALMGVSDGSAAPKVVTVMLTAAGPSPSTARISPYEEVLFVNGDSVAHNVVVRQNKHARWTCSLSPAGEPPSGSDQCAYRAGFVSSHPYTVDGQRAGTVVVVGLARSVTLTARTHTIALGRQLTLHGQETRDNQGDPVCYHAPGGTVFLFARHERSQPFKRIAIFSSKPPKNRLATNNRCTYDWQRKVRPGTATTYIVRMTETHRIWRVATSRPFAVRISP